VLALTGLSCGYYGVYAALFLTVASVYYFVIRRRWRDGRYVGAVVGAAAVAGLLLFPFVKQYFDLGAGQVPVRAAKDQLVYSATWSSYLVSNGLLHRWMLRYLPEWREVLFPGFAALALAAVGAWPGLKRGRERGAATTQEGATETVRFYIAAAAFTFWLSFGPKAGLYSVVYAGFPLLSLTRVPARLGVLVMLLLAVLAAFGVARLIERRRRPWVWAGVLASAALLETTPVPLYLRPVPPTPPIYDVLAALPPGSVVELPFFWRSRDWSRHTLYMRMSTRHWKPLVNGYSDYFPPDFVQNAPKIHAFPAPVSLEILRRYPVRYLLVHMDMYEPRGRAIIDAGVEQLRGQLRPLASVGGDRLFELASWQADSQSAAGRNQAPR
jgi:hypothetical protein